MVLIFGYAFLFFFLFNDHFAVNHVPAICSKVYVLTVRPLSRGSFFVWSGKVKIAEINFLVIINRWNIPRITKSYQPLC